MKKIKRMNREEKRRFIARAIAVLLVAILIFSFAAPFIYGAEKTETSDNKDITIEGSVGFSTKYKVNGPTPFRITLTNNGDNFKGEALIKINVSEDTSMKLYNVYSYPLELPSGSTKNIDMEINVPVIQSTFKTTLINEKGKEVKSKYLLANAIPMESVLVGVLTDDKDSLNYFRQISYFQTYNPNGAVLGENLIGLDEKNFPVTETSIGNFNVIVINDFDTAKFSDLQKTALTKWVQAGGNLIIGTGPNFNKVFRGIGTDIVSVTENGTDRIKNFEQLFGDVPEEEKEKLNKEFSDEGLFISKVTVSNGESVLEAEDKTITSIVKNQLGTIIVHSFDLGLDPVQKLQEQTQMLYTAYESINFDPNANMYGKGFGYNNQSYMVSNLPSLNDSTLIVLFCTVVGYALFIIILYYILKKLDKREKGFIIIPALSLLVTVILFFTSTDTMYKNPIVNSVSKVDLENKSSVAKIDSTTGVFSPSKGNVEVNFNKNVPITVGNGGYMYSGRSMYSSYAVTDPLLSTNPKEKDRLKISFGDKTAVSYYDTSSWGMNSYSMNTTLDLQGSLTGEFDIVDNNLVGSLLNQTPYDLQDVIIGIGSSYMKYPELKKGETLAVDQPIASVDVNLNGSYAIAEKLFDVQNIRNSSAATNEEKRIANLKMNFLSQTMDARYMANAMAYSQSVSYGPMGKVATRVVHSGGSIVMNSNSSGGKSVSLKNDLQVNIYAFNKDSLLSSGVLIGNKIPNDFNMNLLEMHVPLDIAKMNKSNLPFGVIGVSKIYSEVGFDNSDSIRVYVYQEGNIEFTFSLLEGTNLDLFQIKWEDDMYNKMNSLYKKEILNNKTEEWEPLNESEYTENAKDYVNGDGEIVVQAVLSGGGQINLPQIRVKGDN